MSSYIANLNKHPSHVCKWTQENLINVAKKYNCRREFVDNDPNAYNAAAKKGILAFICSHMDDSKKIKAKKKSLKKLSKSEKSEIEEINKSRKNAGFKLIKIKVRKCLVCKIEFESVGQRTCGCTRGWVTTSMLNGIEVI